MSNGFPSFLATVALVVGASACGDEEPTATSNEGTGDTVSLSISVEGGGSVEVGTTQCSSNCELLFVRGERVSLVAKPAAGSTFEGWIGQCEGQSLSASIEMSDARFCGATFSAGPIQTTDQRLNIVVSGNGAVRGASGQINCRSGDVGTCEATVRTGAVLSLEATADVESNWRFVGWRGDCTGNSSVISLVVGDHPLGCEAEFGRALDPCDAVTSLSPPVILPLRRTGGGPPEVLLPNGGLLPDDTLVLSVENESVFPAGFTTFAWEITSESGMVVRGTSSLQAFEVSVATNFLVCERVSVSLGAEACGHSEVAQPVGLRVLPANGNASLCP